MKLTPIGIARTMLAAAAVATVAACGGGGGGGEAPQGSVRFALTDAPGCKVANADLEKVYVTVERVRVHQSTSAEPNGSGWSEMVVDPAPKKINLLDLTNGKLEELGTMPLAAGNYTQVRLVLRANTGNTPANSLVLADGDPATEVEIPLQTPSATHSGWKLIRPFTVAPGTLVDLVIDFDACRSIVAHGNGGYGLKPVMTADLKLVAGIVGVVDPGVAGAMVSAQKNGTVVRSTFPTATGAFTLAYLDPAQSPYDVVITAPARGTSVVANVPAVTTAVTNLTPAGDPPIPLPAAATPASWTASGTLGAADPTQETNARATGVVRALQAVGSVPKIEVTTTNVNALDGTYTLTLPKAQPLLASYPAGLPLSFATPASPPADFSYKLQASATGFVTQEKNIGTGTVDPGWNPLLVVAP